MIKRIKKEDSILVLIDFQERIMPAMDDWEALEDAVVKLAKGCRIMGLETLVTQQYTKGLGSTIPSLHNALTQGFSNLEEAEYSPIEKTSFSAMGVSEFKKALEASGKKTVIIAGIEGHVCVLQTVIDLLDSGYTVFVAADCVSSRKPIDRRMAKSRMKAEGAVYTTAEAILFELCGGAGEPGFKDISKIVK